MKTLALLALSLAVALVMPAPSPGVKSSPEVKVEQEVKKKPEVKVEQKPKEEPEVKVEHEAKEGTEGTDSGFQIYVVPETDEETFTGQGERYFFTVAGKGYHVYAEPVSAEEFEASFGDGHLDSTTTRVIRKDITVRVNGTGGDHEVVVPLNFHFHFHIHVHLHVHVHLHIHVHIHF